MSLRVLHVIPSTGPGGAETLLYRLATRGSDVEHEIVSLSGRDWYSSSLEEQGIIVHHLGMRSLGSTLSGIARLNSIIRRSRADVVQTWMYRSNLLGGILARLARKPVVWGIHCALLDLLPPVSRLFARAGGLVAKWVPDFVINCSARSAEVHRPVGYGKAPGAVIYNGCDPTRFYPDEERREATRQSLGITADTFVIGTIARWNVYKDIPNLLRGVAVAKQGEGVPLKCLLIGHGLDASNGELAEAIDEAGLRDSVLLLGRRGDVDDLARAMDLHVLASASEAFPNTVPETMLSATPNLVTDVGDCALIVGDTGWVVPPRQPEKLGPGLVEAQREWKDEPERWQRRRAASRERIAENFTFDEMAEAYEEVWRSCASGRAVRVAGTDSSAAPR